MTVILTEGVKTMPSPGSLVISLTMSWCVFFSTHDICLCSLRNNYFLIASFYWRVTHIL